MTDDDANPFDVAESEASDAWSSILTRCAADAIVPGVVVLLVDVVLFVGALKGALLQDSPLITYAVLAYLAGILVWIVGRSTAAVRKQQERPAIAAVETQEQAADMLGRINRFLDGPTFTVPWIRAFLLIWLPLIYLNAYGMTLSFSGPFAFVATSAMVVVLVMAPWYLRRFARKQIVPILSMAAGGEKPTWEV